MTSVFKEDVGTEIVLDCGVDITSATVTNIVAAAPSGAVKTWAAVADGSTAIKRVTLAGDLDEAGTWTLQAYVEVPGWAGHGEAVQLIVRDPIQ